MFKEIEGSDMAGYFPQELKNEKLKAEVMGKQMKFLMRLLIMLTYDLKELY